MLLVAGCGANQASAGVEAVESRSTPEGYSAAAFERVQAGLGEFGQLGVQPPSSAADAASSVDIVAGPQLPPRPRNVAVVGDSLTLSAAEEIDAAMASADIRVLTVDGAENRRMIRGGGEVPSGSSAIEAILDEAQPELWVIALGTNDVGAQVGADAFREEMVELLTQLPSDAPVIWVDLWIRDRDDQIVVANRVIRSELGRRRAFAAVVDWHTRADAEGIITGDGVHLTTDGQQLFADSIVEAIDASFSD